jgi:integrase/recombinase XerC
MLLLSKIQQYLSLRSTAMADLGRGDHAFIFITDKGEPLYPKWVYNLVKAQLSLVTSIERKSPHILRHSFATHLSDAGADLNAVKTLLGHASLAATQVYMHNSIEKLKKVYDQAHPKS